MPAGGSHYADYVTVHKMGFLGQLHPTLRVPCLELTECYVALSVKVGLTFEL